MSMKIPKYPKHTPSRWDMFDGIVFGTSSFTIHNIVQSLTSVQPMSISMTGIVFDNISPTILGKTPKKP
jgi:hypothetical protein